VLEERIFELLCGISGSDGGEYEDGYLGFCVLQFGRGLLTSEGHLLSDDDLPHEEGSKHL
jgi:hypothetical protein